MPIIAYEKGKYIFRILTKPRTVQLFLDGKLRLEDVIITDTIFRRFNKVKIAHDSDLEAVFGTADFAICANTIIRKGYKYMDDDLDLFLLGKKCQ
jgi:ribosome maturation protein Sdo1